MDINIKWDDDKAKREVTLTLTWAEAWDLAAGLNSGGIEWMAEDIEDALEDAATEPWTFEHYSELVRSGGFKIYRNGCQLIPVNEAAMRLSFAEFNR